MPEFGVNRRVSRQRYSPSPSVQAEKSAERLTFQRMTQSKRQRGANAVCTEAGGRPPTK